MHAIADIQPQTIPTIEYNAWNWHDELIWQVKRMSIHPLRIFSGSAHPALAEEVADKLGIHVGMSTTRRLADSEIHIMIDEVVRDQDIFFIQPCSVPVNDNLIELLLYLDAFRRASAHSVSAVIPYFPYARQDRMARGREAISARVVADLLESQGAARIIYIDIHNRATQAFFKIPVDPLTAMPLLSNYFARPKFANAAIVSPDLGRAGLAGKYAEKLNLPLVVMHKRRTDFTSAETTHVVGDIAGHRPIIIDDLVAGGSVLKQIDALYKQGAEGGAYFAITHPVLLPTALKILSEDERIEKLITTNTIPIPPEKQHPKIEVLSVAGMLADIIGSIHSGRSISEKLILG
jgi:ribose-phosphate pyrophosphokinase